MDRIQDDRDQRGEGRTNLGSDPTISGDSSDARRADGVPDFHGDRRPGQGDGDRDLGELFSMTLTEIRGLKAEMTAMNEEIKGFKWEVRRWLPRFMRWQRLLAGAIVVFMGAGTFALGAILGMFLEILRVYKGPSLTFGDVLWNMTCSGREGILQILCGG